MALLNEELQAKWSPVLDHPELSTIADPYKKAVTAIVLENQQSAMDADRQTLNESTPGNLAAGISNFDPILISLVRRALPNLIAYDVAGVQPMTGPTGLIFALRSRYGNQTGDEAFYNEANTIFSGIVGNGGSAATGTANSAVGSSGPLANTSFDAGQAMSTALGEVLNPFPQMSITIEKVTVSAKTRALKAEYSLEMAQDLKAIHGLDAETELSNVLSTEILAEINREVIRSIYVVAKPGAQFGTVTSGVFDLDTDSNGRWSVERFKGLIYHIEREANQIAKTTRRGKGNIMIVSSDVASALAMAGVLQYTPNLSADLTVDDTGNTYAGLLHGRIKVYIDPYFGGSAQNVELVTVGYKGTSPYDSGIFYCPYVPLQMVRAVDPDTFQPKIGFKTRYGLVANPFAEGLTQGAGELKPRSNNYYRIFTVKNLM
jgi:hypothetical protein